MMSHTGNQIDDERFILAIKRLSDSLVYGSDLSPYRGSGVDYAQSRPYAAGDPVKSINWRVTARMGKVYVKEFEALKHVPVWLVLDQSLSMAVASLDKSKWEWALMLAGGLALAAINRSSPAGMITTGHVDSAKHPIQHEPSLSREVIYHWLCELRQSAPGSCSQTQISRTLHELEIAARERSLVIVLSDLHERGVSSSLKRLGQRHEVVVLRLQDPAESHPQIDGFFTGEEAETPKWFAVRRNGLSHQSSNLDAELRGAGIDTFTIRLDRDFMPGLREFLRYRTGGRRAGAR